MTYSSGKISGTLEKTNYGNNQVEELYQGTYDYSLTASGGGRLAFKVEAHHHKGDSNHQQWVTVEEKSKVQSDTTLTGQFVADDNLEPTCSMRFNFNREFLSDGVDYVLTYTKRG